MTILNNDKPANNLPAVIDLFSGCGGLAAGFDIAGFPIAGGVDIDAPSVQTALYNLHNRYGQLHGHICADLTEISISDIPLQHSGSGYIVVGGPPCQAYSIAGRGKLRSLGDDRSHLNDPRGNLYEDYVRLCLEIGVEGIVMENVPDSVNYGGMNIPELVCDVFEKEGYAAGWTILNAADYGVPQVRERMILIALKKERCQEISFPPPTHGTNSDQISAWSLRRKKFYEYPHFKVQREIQNDTMPWVTVEEALSDLPVLFSSPSSIYRLYQPNILLPYKVDACNDYQTLMRQWYGDNMGVVSGNSFRKTVRDFSIFNNMKPGDDFRKVAEISERMFNAACRECGVTESEQPIRYNKLRAQIVPPYSRDKFHEKWKRLDKTKPSHTVPAHLCIDTYSHIHPWEPRGISVREAARLQSFPDDYLFQCSMGDAFRQIGNAVPPLLSKIIAGYIKNYFT